MDRLRTSVTLGVILACLPYTFVEAVGPSDTAVLRGGATTLTCSNTAYTSGAALWIEGLKPFGTQQDGIYTGADFVKYINFDIVSTESTQMDLTVGNAQVEDEGTYTCIMPDDQGSAILTVEIEGNEPTLTLEGGSPGNPIKLTAGDQSVLRCTANGFRPAVNLEWYKNDLRFTAGISQDAPTDNGDDTFSTSGTLTLTPTIQDDGLRLECRTTGQMVATAKSGGFTLSVQYAPIVTVVYVSGRITCSSDANPLATSHHIILNGTDIIKTFTNSGGFQDFVPEVCNFISCNATNTIGTGTAMVAEQICPVIPDETTTEMPTTGYVEPTTSAPPTPTTAKPEEQGSPTVVIVLIIVVVLLGVLGLIIGLVCCFKQNKFCFESNKTSNSSSSPKKQPSVANADMIRNQPEVRQSVHKYDDEPKKPRVARSNTGKPDKKSPEKKSPEKKSPENKVPEKEALNQSAAPFTANDHQAYPMDSYNGDPQQGRSQPSVDTYADLEFQNQQGATNGHGKIHYPTEEPTQYASILV